MTEIQRLFLLLALVAAYFLLRVLAPVLTPFLIAGILAYICDPFVGRLQRLRVRRPLAVALVMAGLLVLLLGFFLVLAPIVYQQVALFAEHTPEIAAWIEGTALPWLRDRFLHATGGRDWTTVVGERLTQNLGELTGFVEALLGRLTRGGMAVASFLGGLLLTFVIFGYLLADWDRLRAHLLALVPRRHEKTVNQLLGRCDLVLSSFLRGQLLIMLYVAVALSAGLLAIGVDLAVPIGLLSGAITFIPWLGSAVGVTLSLLAALLEFRDFLHPLLALAWFVIVQTVGDNLITPRVMGDRIGVHPAAILFAVLAGGKLFGLFGLVLAVPAAAVIKVVADHLLQEYRGSRLYAGAPRQRPSRYRRRGGRSV